METSILIGAVLLASDARAGVTVDLLFVGRNGSPIAATDTVTASAGDVLTMAVLMTNDIALTAAAFALSYDLDGDDELDVLFATQWAGFPFFGPPTFCAPPGCLTITPTFVGPFQGAVRPGGHALPPASGAFAGGYQMGTVVWEVTAGVDADRDDIVSGLDPSIIVPFTDAAFNDIGIQVLFHSASVVIPEPGTAALLGLGLLGLALRSRRQGDPPGPAGAARPAPLDRRSNGRESA